MLKKSKFTIGVGLILLVEITHAGAYICTGQIESINQAYDGSISLEASSIYGDHVGRTLCQMGNTWKGVNSDTCKGWLAKLLLSKSQGTALTIQYNDPATNTCRDQPNWSNAANPWAIW